MLKLYRVILFGITLSVVCTISPCIADDYEILEKALKDASVEVNKLNMPGLIYQLDEKSAEKYFEKYFNRNYLNNALRVNIGYPVFHWGNNHKNLQMALSNVLMRHLEEFFAGHSSPSSISTAFKADNHRHNHIFCTLVFFVDIANSTKLSSEYKLEVLTKLISILKLSRLGDIRNARIDKGKYPFVNSVKTQLLMTLFSFAKQSDELKLLSQSIALPGGREELLDIYNVLILDNCEFDNAQLRGVGSFVRSIPNHIRMPIAITCYDKLISRENKLVSVHSFRSRRSFNVFGTKVGGRSENQFPKDYKKVEADGFMIVLAHEYNHNVDVTYVRSTDVLKRFKQQLLKKAGANRNNYLRSMFGDGFFENNPQEFIASLANQYFCSSKDMFLYALKKANEGNLNQINQFILMASIYADGNRTFFYRIDKSGDLRVVAVPSEKKEGLVSAVLLDGKRYSFDYKDGIIVKIDSRQRPQLQ